MLKMKGSFTHQLSLAMLVLCDSRHHCAPVDRAAMELQTLQSQVINLKCGLMQTPALPLDPLWLNVGETYTRTCRRGPGTLTV